MPGSGPMLSIVQPSPPRAEEGAHPVRAAPWPRLAQFRGPPRLSGMWGSAPSPACGGRSGWGRAPQTRVTWRGDRFAPTPTLPRARGRELIVGVETGRDVQPSPRARRREHIRSGPLRSPASCSSVVRRVYPERCGSAPSPACGGRLGWARAPQARVTWRGDRFAPTPTRPTRRSAPGVRMVRAAVPRKRTILTPRARGRGHDRDCT